VILLLRQVTRFRLANVCVRLAPIDAQRNLCYKMRQFLDNPNIHEEKG